MSALDYAPSQPKNPLHLKGRLQMTLGPHWSIGVFVEREVGEDNYVTGWRLRGEFISGQMLTGTRSITPGIIQLIV